MSWQQQVSGTNQDLYVLKFTDAMHGYAAGNNSAAIRTTDGGASWVPIDLGAGAPSNISFRSIGFIDASTAFLCGCTSVSVGVVYKTTDGSNTWTYLPGASQNNLYGLTFTSALTGYGNDYNGAVIKTEDGGDNWTSTALPGTTINGNICFPTATTGITSGYNNIYRTDNAGATWTTVMNGVPASYYYTSVDFCDAMNGFVVGGIVGAGGTAIILRTIDGGLSWTNTNPGPNRLFRVDYLDVNTAYAVGLGGRIMKFSTQQAGLFEHSSAAAEVSNYPNPFSKATVISAGNHVFAAVPSVEVYDLSGKHVRTVLSEKGLPVVVDRSGFEAGAYIYYVFDGTQRLGSGKMIVE